MRKIVTSLAVAGSALTLAAPVTAQNFDPPDQYGFSGYRNNYGYDYGRYDGYNGYNYNGDRAHMLGRQIERLNRRIQGLGRAGVLSSWQVRSLSGESRSIADRLRDRARYGVTDREQRRLQMRLTQLEQRIARAASDGDRRRGDTGWNGNWDRDR
jgi:hypothetical protein